MEKFKEIYKGQERAHGCYQKEGGINEKGKMEGRSLIVRKPPTDDLWEQHLSGERSLGIIPITDDNTCQWGCIDIDDYPLDHKKIINKIREEEFPLIVCRSKSGGAHIFCFTKSFISARLMRQKLEQIAGELGYAGCEIFPKQEKIEKERGDVGNFLNLPYFGGTDNNRYAFLDDGSAANLEEFYTLVEKFRISEEDFSKIKLKKKKNFKEMSDGPPCLETFMSTKVQQGTRDVVLFHYSVYAKKKWPKDWQDKISEFNQTYMEIPLKMNEVIKTIKQHETTDYNYTCKIEPMCSHCNSSVCQTRKFGIGDDFESKFDDLTKFQSDESQWFITVDGKRLSLSNNELYDQNLFRKACMGRVNILPNSLNPRDWTARLQALLSNVKIIEMPVEVTAAGRFAELLEEFITDQGDAIDWEGLRLGQALHKNDKIYFRLEALVEFLTKKQFKSFNQTQIHSSIRGLDGDSETTRISGKVRRVWYVPKEFALKDKDQHEHDSPTFEEEIPF
tara:strand:- start:1180 stop:2694 length:1515 start_codon:yes stop_codon:yes gene_type:complete